MVVSDYNRVCLHACMCVGVKNADENELKIISSEPHDTHTYNVADFAIMNTIVEGLTRTVCEGVQQQDKEINSKYLLIPTEYGYHWLLKIVSYMIYVK